jgi:hypothetical protein
MASAQAFPTSFKGQLLGLTWAAADVIKMALYTQAGQTGFGAATTVYTTVGEIANGNGYTTGGTTMSGFTSSTSGTTGYMDWSTDPNWTTSTITSDMCLIYNTTRTNAAMAVLLFTSTASTNGTFTVQLPAAGASAVITIA